MPQAGARRLPVGAEVLAAGGVDFRVWAPARRRVEAVVEGGERLALEPKPDGYFQGFSRNVSEGSRYRFCLDGEDALYPDPASRFQPEGPEGPSEVVDPSRFRWTDGGWRGCGLRGQIVYEMHVGTFTSAGTWPAARDDLPALADLGITLIEMMPVAEFAGSFGWGYDGVDWFAPTHLYGTPDDLRRFVDAAHGLGMGVLLDVVYNHLGPAGNYLPKFSPHYFSKKHSTDWGPGITPFERATRRSPSRRTGGSTAPCSGPALSWCGSSARTATIDCSS